MPGLVARLLAPLLDLVAPGTGRRRLDSRNERVLSPPPVEGPAPRQFGARPLRGEDHALVRPYVVAHELREQERRRQARRRSLLIAPRGVHLHLIPPHTLGLTA
ncbi:hypothetical protein C1708_14930 [Streptomyces sp. DH-12]|uniref:hypothetical protein n=1 Tax=Streptomyces sp. DH-12 TaxID=2072509 RepID=UPI000CCDB69A|nr:hypothetical protein [Streptomyces sp. DH-12]PNV33466.1 hypothetical protein C1708_14930 [Streptomyces sp. DH-12]